MVRHSLLNRLLKLALGYHLCSSYCRGRLFRVTQCLFEGFTDAVMLVITFAEQPQLISPLLENVGPNAPWGHMETLFLLAAYVFGGFLMDTLEFSLRHRTATTRQRRLQRVVDSLLSRGLISLPTQKKQSLHKHKNRYYRINNQLCASA